ncbi:MAG: hypothetical protein QXJ18_03335 [Desulfurococcaceae archaeon]
MLKLVKLVKCVLGLVAGIATGLLSVNGVPVSLLLLIVRVHQLSSSCIVNTIAHVALNTAAWLLLGAVFTDKKKEWGVFAWFAASTVITATVLTALYVFTVLIAILAVAPGL